MTGTYTYETAPLPNGCPDTYILGLDSTGKVVAKDDQSGVGAMSRFTSSTARSVVLGAFTETMHSAVNL